MPRAETPNRIELTRRVKAAALELGFDDARVAPAKALTRDGEAFQRWLEKGRGGAMEYLADRPERRSDPELLLPGASSVLVLAAGYHGGKDSGREGTPPPGYGRVARYARGRDYHNVLGRLLKKLRKRLEGLAGRPVRSRSFVDAGPLLERAFAREAGLGFIGKHSLLIHRTLGSWAFLAAMVSDLPLVPDEQDGGNCGQCTLCLDACPTGAIVEPFVVDARQCLSYLTIEVKGPDFPEGSAESLHGWIFGCDVCQEVCPYNARELPAPRLEEAFSPGRGAGPALPLDEVQQLDDEEYRARFQGTPLMRPKREGLARNARLLSRERCEYRPSRRGPRGSSTAR